MMDNKEINQLATSFYEISQTCFIQGSPWSKEQFMSFFESTHHYHIVVKKEEKIVGFLLLSSCFEEGEIELIGVSKSYQRRGIGKLLLNKSFLLLKDKEVAHLLLEVRQSNQQAQSFYQGLGFKEISRRKNYYRNPQEDALIWRLDL